jgi:hypothetical protein
MKSQRPRSGHGRGQTLTLNNNWTCA